LAVQKYILGKGVAKAKVNIAYFGETKPVETNETIEGRRKNRRVEFKITNP
jgi:OmpA-OmpF porin, OOP family